MAGDKMTIITVDDTSDMPENVKQAHGKIGEIFEKHLQQKRDARDALHADFDKRIETLAERNKYAYTKIGNKVYEALKEKAAAQSQNDVVKEMQRKLKDFSDDKVKKALDALKGKDPDAAAQQEQYLNDKLDEVTGPVVDNVTDISSLTDKDSRSGVQKSVKFTGQHAVSDPIVHDYEAGYLASGLSKDNIIKDCQTYCEEQGLKLEQVEKESGVTELQITDLKDPDNRHHVGTLYENEKRFEKIQAEQLKNGVVPELYAHRRSGKQYVKDRNDVLVRRYVYRALNDHDLDKSKTGKEAVQIKLDGRDIPDGHPNKQGTVQKWSDQAAALNEMEKNPAIPQDAKDKKLIEEIQNHQSKKEAQKGSPLISHTSTERPIFGSSATKFAGPNGVAKIDLAYIPKESLIDTHTDPARKWLYDMDEPPKPLPFDPKNPKLHVNNMARDAFRTRELVTSVPIPNEAIVEYPVQPKAQPGKSTPAQPTVQPQSPPQQSALGQPKATASQGLQPKPPAQPLSHQKNQQPDPSLSRT